MSGVSNLESESEAFSAELQCLLEIGVAICTASTYCCVARLTAVWHLSIEVAYEIIYPVHVLSRTARGTVRGWGIKFSIIIEGEAMPRISSAIVN